MLPLWPSINSNPSLIGSLMNNGATGATNEEQEIRWIWIGQVLIHLKVFKRWTQIFSALEQEQQNYLNLVETIAADLTPLGKLQSEQNNEDSDAESAASDGK